jgi:hypothetical protein
LLAVLIPVSICGGVQAFQEATAHLRSLSKDQLARLSAGALSDFLERSAQGERPVLPGVGAGMAPASGGVLTNATLVRTTVGSEEPPTPLGPVLGPQGGRRGSAQQYQDEQETIASEVRRISMEYNEEKQKLDLMMKIQQTRQRQALQKKLFEKNQRKQQQHQLQQHQSEEADGYQADSKSDYDSVNIGANRGLAALKPRSGASLQPAFKGLPAEAYQGSAPTGGGAAGYSSSSNKLQTQQSMALRGMNLGPLMRK